jgi:hypothetical protein
MLDHLNLDARIGRYEASATRVGEVREFYTETAALINCGPDNIAFSGSATHAYATALSATRCPTSRVGIAATTAAWVGSR